MDLKPIADQFNIPFFHVPFTKDNKESGEKQQIELLESTRSTLLFWPVSTNHNTKFDFAYENKIINIHHSFTCFPGAKPYHSAFKEE
jgi:formyltetrahydrofolate deformylase